MKKIQKNIYIFLAIAAIGLCTVSKSVFAANSSSNVTRKEVTTVLFTQSYVTIENVEVPLAFVSADMANVDEEESEEIDELEFDANDIWYLAKVCLAEAENQSELGKRYVIDTVLNRLDDEDYPNTVEEVIKDEGQFECMYNGRFDSVDVTDEVEALVIEELKERTNSEVFFFRTKRYSRFGTPLFQEDDHYFSAK